MRRNLHHGRMMGSMGIVALVVLAAFMFLGLMQTPASAESELKLTGEPWTPTAPVGPARSRPNAAPDTPDVRRAENFFAPVEKFSSQLQHKSASGKPHGRFRR